jgi:hypothetical protein
MKKTAFYKFQIFVIVLVLSILQEGPKRSLISLEDLIEYEKEGRLLFREQLFSSELLTKITERLLWHVENRTNLQV